MTKIAIIDTETAKLEGEVIELAYIEINYPQLVPLERTDLFFKPVGEIDYGAMAVHNIIPSELIGCDVTGGDLYKKQVEYLETFDYVIGHNVDYDYKVLSLTKPKKICTLAMARKLIPDTAHGQNALMYYFFEDKKWVREKVKNAHNALCDVGNCLLIFSKLLELAEQKHYVPDEEISYIPIEELYEFAEFCRIPDKLHFGKHKGKTYLEVAKTDPGYFDWWRNKSDTKPDEYQMKAILNAMANR